MLIGLFTILATLLFGGGNTEELFILPNAQKVVKQTIEDPDRKDQATLEMKNLSKEWKKLQKIKKKQAKNLAKMNKDLSTDAQALADLFENYKEERRNVKDQLITFRLNIQDIMTDDEWSSVISQIEDVKPKKAKKQEKAQLKEALKKDKKFRAVEDEIEAAFTDPEKLKEVKIDMEQFEDDLADLIFTMQEESLNMVEVMRDRNASRDDITEAVMMQEDERAVVHASFLKFRKELVELSTEDNWPKIAKALNKFL